MWLGGWVVCVVAIRMVGHADGGDFMQLLEYYQSGVAERSRFLTPLDSGVVQARRTARDNKPMQNVHKNRIYRGDAPHSF